MRRFECAQPLASKETAQTFQVCVKRLRFSRPASACLGPPSPSSPRPPEGRPSSPPRSPFPQKHPPDLRAGVSRGGAQRFLCPPKRLAAPWSSWSSCTQTQTVPALGRAKSCYTPVLTRLFRALFTFPNTGATRKGLLRNHAEVVTSIYATTEKACYVHLRDKRTENAEGIHGRRLGDGSVEPTRPARRARKKAAAPPHGCFARERGRFLVSSISGPAKT